MVNFFPGLVLNKEFLRFLQVVPVALHFHNNNNNNDLYSANSLQCSNALYNKITQSKNRIQ